MSNRKKIEKFCNENKIEIVKLEFIRNMEYVYGDSTDASYWLLECIINGNNEFYESYNGMGIDDGVDSMLEDILDDLKEQQK